MVRSLTSFGICLVYSVSWPSWGALKQALDRRRRVQVPIPFAGEQENSQNVKVLFSITGLGVPLDVEQIRVGRKYNNCLTNYAFYCI